MVNNTINNIIVLLLFRSNKLVPSIFGNLGSIGVFLTLTSWGRNRIGGSSGIHKKLPKFC